MEKKRNKALLKSVLKESVPVLVRSQFLYLSSGAFCTNEAKTSYSSLREKIEEIKINADHRQYRESKTLESLL